MQFLLKCNLNNIHKYFLRHRIRECGEKRAADSRRKMACLVADYLQEEGYHRTAACFRDEAPLLRHYELCDNVSLSGVLTQFEEYHSLRFHKEAKVCKKSPDGPPQQDKTSRPLKTRGTSPPGADGPPQQDVTSRPLKTHGTSAPGAEGPPQLDVTCRPMETRGTSPTGETPELSWDDVVGQQRAKSALMMAVVYPAKYPQLFRGLVQPARSMLLYGPPGTGKTMLARVVAHHSQATFFDVPASSVVSKWRGESEKLLGAVFQAARSQAPAIVFMDELDSIASRRGLDGEHEASRRLLAELLLLMDRLLSQADERLFLLAATNVPWQLDPAVLRRFEATELVDLPGQQDREQCLRRCLPGRVSEQPPVSAAVEYGELAARTAGLSCCDLHAACKKVILQQVCAAAQVLEQGGSLQQVRPSVITTQQVCGTLLGTKPCDPSLVARYHAWQGHLPG
ncbi:katanin p60 ATPase-containing subunit A-like 2 isoform X2 [Bacillus rossius redtenbacheri]|uniref:katanin p60 ATPase-containing subunit A-like 2 isoform X2 n=1 Tax=Bacillus rossius redtenbacheri TaxID=93214 RepID=UPI002FDEB729